jgi:hypothetical protein
VNDTSRKPLEFPVDESKVDDQCREAGPLTEQVQHRHLIEDLVELLVKNQLVHLQDDKHQVNERNEYESLKGTQIRRLKVAARYVIVGIHACQ